MRLRTLFPAVLVAALAQTASAQQVTFSGTIEEFDLPSICQEQTHVLTCNGAWLKSSAVDLSQFEGGNATFTAVKRGVTCTVYDVISAKKEPFELIQCGNPVPGCPMRFKVEPEGFLGQAWYFYSLSPDLLDIGGQSLLLGSPIFFLGTAPMVGPNPHVDITLPPTVVWTGTTVYVQAAYQSIGPVGPLTPTNATCFTILGPSPPCFLPNC